MVREHVKKVATPLFTLFCTYAPLSMLSSALKMRRNLIDYIPKNRRFLFTRYLGSLVVSIDTTYPIERQMLTGTYEKETLNIIRHFVKSGDTCMDIGANVGAITLALAQCVGDQGNVYAIEPADFLFEKLKRNINLNPSIKKVVHVCKCGFSDKEEVRAWNEDPDNRGNGGFIMQKTNQPLNLELTTLDRFAQKQILQSLDFLKIDVEGMEYEVLKGGLQTLKRYKPVIFYETGIFNGRFWSETKRKEKVILKAEEMLMGIGYIPYKVDKGTLYPTCYPDLSYNTVAIPESVAFSWMKN